ncbi:MAG: bifunctional phosphopantothenoylcysteine decarboxylase/phosphopantothenate--cysteine ligase CoaBC [Bacteroidales bacterium]|nr:bifunctional phosphopantothenoylcysteine decarboxylase/phosphopantothenate--cysteine ligase CoaBC [Bacteroidales bacterium]MDD3891543.1 bifunctional phosphopantothenoylcysteine decarboxylase/phosphopantothenate--cysteine ligase CoaBC [Bacteroidales bacterium]
MLKGKNILLGITGSIAAYKTASLVRLLVKEGASVKVIMTPLAKEFITPLTMATLSKNPILVDFFNPENGDWNSHVDLGLWADLYLIAPASANTMAKMASGVADNLLLTSYLSARCPVMVAPAMDLDMFQHPTTQKNIEVLKGYGNIIIEATTGELASGLSGKGRMEEPEKIFEAISLFFSSNETLKGKLVLVTSGPTHEPIDPIRFIGNRSSGLMGASTALSLVQRGAKVLFVTGPSSQKPVHKDIEIISVSTAQQMYDKAVELYPRCDAAVLAAAVADFSVKQAANQKIKREDTSLMLELVPTQDIAKELGKMKSKTQLLVGFALETQNQQENAMRKLKTKNFDFIVLNSPNDEGAGFDVLTNKVTIIHSNGNEVPYPLKSKAHVADDIVNELVKLFK